MIRRQIAHNNTCNFSGKDIPWLILKLLSGNEARPSSNLFKGVRKYCKPQVGHIW